MKSIYASKLYRSSKRKDKIAAALFNSSNSGLVQQLADSLDEEYRKKDLLDPEDGSAQNESGSDSEGGSAASTSGGGSGSSGSFSGGGGSFPSSFSSGLDDESFDPETDLVDFPEGAEESESGSSEEGDSAAEDLAGPDTGVKEATEIKACTLDAGQLTILKETLNSVEGLAGVTRIVVKDNELWIYYNDDTNLNNIMTDVIEYIGQGYAGVDFNRLARSDNAIVFERCMSTGLQDVS